MDALNRIGFTESLMEETRQITVSGSERTMVMIDLDGFKEVNDIYGHDAGDTVLVEIVERLRQFAGQDAIIGRLGGDEFAIILEDSCPPRKIESCLKRMLALIERPVMIGETGVSVSAGIGYTHITRTVAAVQQSLKDADLALLQAKQEGGKRIVSFTPDLRSRARQHQLLMGQARQALERGEFELYYQPVIDLAKGCITFCEALLRWHHPQLGLLTPVAFSDVFSDFQMGVQLGRLVRETVVRDLAGWSENGLYDGGVALNLSVADFGADGLADELCRLTREYAVAREKVKIEITETIFLGAGRSDRVRREIDRIARAGFPVAFDDFGTGYASISHLRELPLSHIKIDRSFIANIKDDARDLAITSGLIGLAQGIHLSVVAEGVETVDQLRVLDDLGCTECQGFLFARPVPAARVPEAVRQACLVQAVARDEAGSSFGTEGGGCRM
ncbi:putative bifunctional diguanylate cyclase/phosphodiesterase [Acetobacter estunensis]|uniref:putative bifunctional diguanylate cyclase/phosphodiesterase n=1 Tax=Acetobacter estunensis TaxID=104097 RepID=UPI00349FE54A